MSTITAPTTLTGTLHHRPHPQPHRVRRPPRHGHQGPRLVQRVRGLRLLRRREPAELRAAAHDPGRQHRHPQRRPRRPPARATTSSTWRPTRRSRSSSTAVEQVDADNYRVTGDLTIKGVTKPVTVDFEYTGAAVDPFGNQPHRLRRHDHRQPQGLGRQLERRPRGRRRARRARRSPSSSRCRPSAPPRHA